MRLLPVQVSRAPALDVAVLEVVIAGGARVHFEPGTDVDYVARLVTALGLRADAAGLGANPAVHRAGGHAQLCRVRRYAELRGMPRRPRSIRPSVSRP